MHCFAGGFFVGFFGCFVLLCFGFPLDTCRHTCSVPFLSKKTEGSLVKCNTFSCEEMLLFVCIDQTRNCKEKKQKEL